MNLLESLLLSAVFLAPFYSMLYGIGLILFDTVAEWLKGDNEHN